MFHGDNEPVTYKDVGTLIASASPRCLDNNDGIDSVTMVKGGSSSGYG